MFDDILSAFIASMLIVLMEVMFTKRFKDLVIVILCTITISEYFIYGLHHPQQTQLKINFGIWILFIILFDRILLFLINKYLVPLANKLEDYLNDKNEGESSS